MLKINFFLIVLFFGYQTLLSQEIIRIQIDNESFSREMPTAVDEAQILIRQLVDMYNELAEFNNQHIQESLDLVSQLRDQIEALSSENDDLIQTVENVQKGVKSISMRNMSLAPMLGVNYLTNFNNTQHVQINGGLNIRIFRNILLAPEIGVLISSNHLTPISQYSLMIGVKFGWWIK